MPTVTPFLWFEDNLEEAVSFYRSVFPDSSTINITRGPDGKAFTAEFSLAGQSFYGLSGNSSNKFNEGVSFFITCEDQKDVDFYWDKLVDGGSTYACGWLKDKFGLVWQVAPKELLGYLTTGTEEQKARARTAMEGQIKIEIGPIEKAWKGE